MTGAPSCAGDETLFRALPLPRPTAMAARAAPRIKKGQPPASRGKGERAREARERWEAETLRPFLEKSPERSEEFMTTSSVPVKRLYTSEDLSGFDELRDLGFPGEFPFTRGVYPTMYRGRLWTMRLFSGFRTAAETNRRLK